MGLNPMTWKTRNIAQGILSIVFFYMLFVYKKKHQVIFEGIISNSSPWQIWDFMADFSNIKKLNPTIEDFTVLDEKPLNSDEWEYIVEYTEHLSHLPMIRNVAQGYYKIVVKHPETHVSGYFINSMHRTCFFNYSVSCLESISELRFEKVDEDTKYVETIQYECPIAFSPLCRKEVMYQRKEILKGVKQKFKADY